MIKLVISGIAGRMGKRISALAAEDKDFAVTGGLESEDSPFIGKDIGDVLGTGGLGKDIESDFEKLASDCDVVIEFTTPEATMKHLEIAQSNNVAIVIGTTALVSSDIDKIKTVSKKIPIVFSPNMSIGANLLFRITEDASRSLGEDYEVKILEVHHTKKKDAPSGTAKRLGEAVSKVRGKTPPIKSIREGDIAGDHSVIFTGKYETIELKHSAHSRDVFAKGALLAAKFLKGKKPGLYTMQDVIEVRYGF
ncbi:MAG: 4-hydroxy-tetrahydrodipicolinate reductase [Candidatus Omnitrophica bacterium]|nr:4-hydroxy-tetrahydrodipicolinate reductase [Candidatus Omnitrophota bacterium]